MDIISKKLYGNDINIEKRNILWNMLGSLVYALTSMIIGIIVNKISGEEIGGIFFFAFTTLGQQLYIIAYFAIRPIQITDTSNRYSFGDYLLLRIITSAIGLILGLTYILLFSRNKVELYICILMLIYKILDALADCYESEWQRKGRLYMAGKSILIRTLVSVFIFVFILYFTKNIILGSICFVLSLICCIYIFLIRPLSYISIDKKFIKYRVIKLFKESSYLFISTFLDLFIFAASKFSVNLIMGSKFNSYYSIIFIPTSIINLMAGFIIRPILGNLSLYYEKKQSDKLKKTIFNISLLIIAFTIISSIFSNFLGGHILKILFGALSKKELKEYTYVLIIVIIGGGFYALMNLLYYILVIFRKEKYILISYIFGSVLAFYISNRAVYSYGLIGAGISYLLLMILLSLIFLFLSYKYMKKI